MRCEYDFSGGVRGKRFRSMQAGYTVTVHQTDGSTVVTEVKPDEGVVVLEPDVRIYFPDSDSVNEALRGLIRLLPPKATAARDRRSKRASRKASGGVGKLPAAEVAGRMSTQAGYQRVRRPRPQGLALGVFRFLAGRGGVL